MGSGVGSSASSSSTLPPVSSTTAAPHAGGSAAPKCSEFNAQITEADSGGEVNVGGETSRFSICLDEAKHPLSQLGTAGCPFGYVSNLSVAGPDNYPIGYEVTAKGLCTVRNGDYQVRVVTTA
jgi:hypothetical protein